MNVCFFCGCDAIDECIYCGYAVCLEHSFTVYDDESDSKGYACLECLHICDMEDDENGENEEVF